MSQLRIALVTSFLIVATACGKSKSSPCSDCGTAVGATVGGGGPAAQDLAPVPGTGPTFSSLSPSGYTVTWTAATDDHTTAEGLEYQLVATKSAADLATVQLAEAVTGSSVLLPWTAGTLTVTVAGRPPAETLTYAVLVKDQAGNVALYPAQTVTTLAQGSPTPGAALTFGTVGSTSLPVQWGVAANPGDPSLSYKVVYASATTALDTVQKADAITGSAASAWLPGATSLTLTGLSAGTTYAVAVLVKNSAGAEALYSPVTKATRPKWIFRTQSNYAANLGGAAGADGDCNADPGKPAGGGSFKAFVAAPWRRACLTANCGGGVSEHVDWPLAASTPYAHVNGTLIATTTTLGLFPSTLASAVGTSHPYDAWGGFGTDWTTLAQNCVGWTSVASSDTTYLLDLGVTTDTATFLSAGSGAGGCDTPQPLLCIEQ